MTPDTWPSLAPQTALARRLPSLGEAAITTWLATQVDRCSDPAFIRLFADHIDLPGIAPADYAHRLIDTRRGRLLGGIRFYGQDITRPFVEVLAHSFDDLPALTDCIAQEWQAFRPTDLRLLLTPEEAPPAARLDMSVHAAPYARMAPPDGKVRLDRPSDPAGCIALVNRRYADLAQSDPGLAANLRKAGADDIRDWHATGGLCEIRRQDRPIGCLAIAGGAVAWLTGDEVMEEVIATVETGHGYAASAQRAWAAEPGRPPDRLLLGMIDAANPASRRTAERASRPALLNYVFLPLPTVSDP